jgi:CspA family cold shock protein
MRQEGTVKWFDDAKGLGMITPNDGGADVFVHHSVIITEGYRTLNEGDRVSFIAYNAPKGPTAREVKKLDPF